MAFKLVPSEIQEVTEEDMNAIKTNFEHDIPNEIGIIKGIHFAVNYRITLASSLIPVLGLADPGYYPNIFLLLFPIQVSYVPCERSISALRRLKDWSKLAMLEDRLIGFVVM